MSLPRPSNDEVPSEPFSWMSKSRSPGPYRFTMKSPASEAAMGAFLVAIGIFIVVNMLANPSGAALVSGLIIFVIFAGLGVLLLVMAVARRRWGRAYRQVHGRLPY